MRKVQSRTKTIINGAAIGVVAAGIFLVVRQAWAGHDLAIIVALVNAVVLIYIKDRRAYLRGYEEGILKAYSDITEKILEDKKKIDEKMKEDDSPFPMRPIPNLNHHRRQATAR